MDNQINFLDNNIHPDVIPVQTHSDIVQLGSNLNVKNQSIVPIAKPLQSANFQTDTIGWQNDSSGNVEMNGNVNINTYFRATHKENGITFYNGNQNDPDGIVTGNVGDICYNGDNTGRPYFCLGGTSWKTFKYA